MYNILVTYSNEGTMGILSSPSKHDMSTLTRFGFV